MNVKYYMIGYAWGEKNLYKLVRNHWYIYMNDIKEAKGRKSRKIFYLHREGVKKYDENYYAMWALDRV